MITLARLKRLYKLQRVLVMAMPFVYITFYLGVFALMSLTVLVHPIWNQLVYVAPSVVLYSLVLSFSIGLCWWHKLACTLPLIPFGVVVYHLIICDLTGSNTNIFVGNCILFILCLVSGVMMFIRNKNNE